MTRVHPGVILGAAACLALIQRARLMRTAEEWLADPEVQDWMAQLAKGERAIVARLATVLLPKPPE